MPLQSYQSKRRKLDSSSTSASAAAAAAASSPPSASSSSSTNKPYNYRPTTPAKRPSSSLAPAKSNSSSSKSTPKPTAIKKRRASVIYVDASDDDAALPVYTVEAISKHRKAKDGHYQYWIKWEGYPESQNTWEYDRNVLDKSLIEAYWDSYADHRLRAAEDELEEVQKRRDRAQVEYEEAKRRFVREMSSGHAQSKDDGEVGDDEEQDRMDVDDNWSEPPSPKAAAQSLPRAVRSKHPAAPPVPPSPMRKLPSLTPNGSPDRRHPKLRRLVARKDRDTRGSSVDTDAKGTDAEVDVDDQINDFDLDKDDDYGIILTAVRSPTRPRPPLPPRPRPTPPPAPHHIAAAPPGSAGAAAPSSPAPNRSKCMAQRIADMDQDEIFAFLESRDSPKPEPIPRFSPQVMDMLNKLTEPELVQLLAARDIQPPDNSSHICPSPSQHANGRAEDPAPLAPVHTVAGDHGKATQAGGDQDDGEPEDDEEAEEESDSDQAALEASHPLAGMHLSLANLLAEIPEDEIMEWVFDRKYEAQIDQVLGFDDTSPETQAALADGVGAAADPLVYVAYKDGSEARVSLGNLIRRAPAVAAEFLLNMRVQILEEEMVAAAALQTAGKAAAAAASQRVPLVQGMFGSQMRRTVSLPRAETSSSSDSDEDVQGDVSGPTGPLDEQDGDDNQGEVQGAGRLLDASDVDLASGAPPSEAVASVHFRYVRESSQQPMDSPSKVDLRPTAPLTSPTPARPKLTLDASGESDSEAEREASLRAGPSQTLARSSVSPVSKPLGSAGHGPPVSPPKATAGDGGAAGQQSFGLLASLVQTFTPKKWSSLGPGDGV